MIYHHGIEDKNQLQKLVSVEDEISFDGVHKSVYSNYTEFINKSVYLFIIGSLVGVRNYCNWDEIMGMAKLGAKLGWHTENHIEPAELEDDDEMLNEIVNPYEFKYFALPFGRYTKRYLYLANKHYDKVFGTNLKGKNIILRKTI